MDEKELEAALDKKFKEQQSELQKLQAEGATKDEVVKLHDAIKTQGLAIEAFREETKVKQIETFAKQLEVFLIEKKDELENIAKTKKGEIEFIPKVVAAVTTANGTDIGVPNPLINTNLGHFNLRNDNNLMELMSVTSTSKPYAPYTELTPKDGNYAFVAEGQEKPQIDFKWENRYPEPKKIAAYEILTEEALTDVPRLMSIAREYLTKKHDLFKVSALFFASGVGDLPTGATVYGRTFSAGPLAGTIANPNFMHVVNAGIVDVYTTQNYTDEMEFMPNVVLINPIDFFLQFQAATDGDGLPLYPQASLFNTVTIGGVTIKPWVKIPAGKIFIADMSKYNVVNYVPFSIRIGLINDQFITNQLTMLGESRFFQYVKNLDQQAFLYDDIATIKTAITPI